MPLLLHGVHVPHRKHTAGSPAVALPTPSLVALPMSMHIGRPAVPVVKVGDHVDVGTLVGEADGFVSSPVYASVSGTVKRLERVIGASGASVMTVTVESDGQMSVDASIAPPVIESREELVEAIRRAGIVGLGGAGFPTHVKFSIPDGARVEEIIVNGAECEPYITSDTRTMLDRAEDMAYAFSLLERFFGVKRIIIGIEKNKKEAIAAMRALAKHDTCLDVRVLPALYPQGGEKVLIYHTTGKVVPAGKLPLDVGCIVVNCTTVASIGRYAQTGMPLVTKCVTVDGGAVAEPKNVLVPIGTPLSDVLAFCGMDRAKAAKILLGGPMMGVAVPDTSVSVMKNTNAVLALTEAETACPETTQCIRCGSCSRHCPFRLDPAAFERAYRVGDIDKLGRLRVDICMECGCCSYVCPARRPLTQINKLGKAALRDKRMAEKKKEESTK